MPTPKSSDSISGLYLDDKYFLHYPSGMKMTDGIPDEVMAVIDPHWSQVHPTNDALLIKKKTTSRLSSDAEIVV